MSFHQERRGWTALAGLMVLGAAGLIAANAGPWLRVSSLPVVAEIDASPNARLSICTDNTCARLVRKDGHTWLAELPPLQRYELVVQTENLSASLRSITIVQTNGAASPVLSIAPENGNIWPESPLAIGTVTIATEAQIVWDTTFVFLLCLAFLSLIALSIVAFARSVRVSPQAVLSPTVPRFYWIVWGLLSVVGGTVIASTPIHFSADTPVYLRHAMSLLNSGDYALPGADPWNATVRTPGYPAFLALAFLFGVRTLSTIALIQYAIHAISIALLGSILARLVQSKIWQFAFLAFALLGLPHIALGRSILSDSLCASLIVVAVYFFLLFKWGGRQVGLLCFGLSIAAAAMVRPAAAIAVLILLPDLLASLYRVATRRGTIWEVVAVAMGLLVATAPVLGWSARNYIKYRYYAASSYAPLVRLEGLIETGTFNVSSSPHDNLYDFYVLGRNAVQYREFHSQMTEVVAHIYRPHGRRYIIELNDGLKDVINTSLRASPRELRMSGFIRAFAWGLFFPDGQTYGGYRHREYDEVLKTAFRSPGDAVRAQASLRDVPSFSYTPKEPNALTWAYAEMARTYSVLYPWIALAAFLAAAAMLLGGNLVAALPVLFYFLNVALHAYIGTPFGRYIQPIDTFLMFSIIVAAADLPRISSRRPPGRSRLAPARLPAMIP